MNENVLLFRLDELISLAADESEIAVDVEVTPGLDLPEHGVQDDVRTSSSNSGTTMNDNWPRLGWIRRRGLPNEAEDGKWAGRDSVVGPSCEVELGHDSLVER